MVSSVDSNNELEGRKCPYCHTDLESGDELHPCENCGAIHHEDCWSEGGGCSVFGCQSSDGRVEQGGSGGEPSATSAEGDHDFAVQLASANGQSNARNHRRLAIFVGGGLTIAALAAGGFFLFGSDGEKSDATLPTATPKKKQTRAEKRAEAERKSERNLTLRLEPVWVDDPGGSWAARLPQGDGWTKPDSEGDLNGDSYNPLYRTLLWGPDGFVVVDTTPAEDPTENLDNYTVAGELLNAKEVSTRSFALGEMVSYKNGDGECEGSPCVKAMLSDGTGGGVTVWVKSASMKEAKEIARTFAESAERGY